MRLHPLALWDAPFLPSPEEARGRPLAEARGLPLLERRQLAAQLLAASSFYLAQGFYPSRSLLRSSRFSRRPGSAWLFFTGFPARRLEEDALSRRLARTGLAELLPWAVLRPLLEHLVPEERPFWQKRPRDDPWGWPQAALSWLLAKDRSGKTLAHPDGLGRFLWARQVTLPPEGGAFFCQEPRLASRLARSFGLGFGELAEEELAALQGARFAGGGGALVLCTSPIPGLPPLPLAPQEPFWLLLPHGGAVNVGVPLAGLDLEDPQGVGTALAKAVAEGWGGGKGAETEVEKLLSYPARKLLTALRGVGVGLSREEATRLFGAGPVDELQRFSLVVRRFGRFWPAQEGEPNPSLALDVGRRLGEGPVAVAAVAIAHGAVDELVAWAEACLDEGRCFEVLALVTLAQQVAPLAPLVCEAALFTGWLSAGRGLWPKAEGARHALLVAWWGAETGEGEALRQGLKVLEAEGARGLPRRLLPRLWLLLALAAERRGEREKACSLAEQVLAEETLPETWRVEAAYYFGFSALQPLVASLTSREAKQRALHLLGVLAFQKGDYLQAQAWLTQALAHASGANPLRFGELLSDAGSTAMMLGKATEAERLFAAAELWFALAGSQRALRLVRFNRAVLANDRLAWRKAQELLSQLRDEEEAEDPFALVEWARSWLACGNVAEAQGLASKLEQIAADRHLAENLRQGAATALAHLWLLAGDLPRARRWAAGAEPSEKVLFEAVFRARLGHAPSPELCDRWGMVLTAQLLALGRTSPAAAFRVAESALARGEIGAAVGLARALLLAPMGGEALLPSLRPLWSRAANVLREHHMAWGALLRKRLGRSVGEVAQALQAIFRAGLEPFQPAVWRGLQEALGLAFLRINRGERRLLALGGDGTGRRWELAGFVVELPEDADEESLAVLSLALGQLPHVIADREEEEEETLGLAGESAAIREVRNAIRRLAPLAVTVLIQGEPGTGKERVARALHRLSGRGGEFVAVNCAGMPEGLLEAELFGVVKGAFTGADRDRPGLVEQAEGGTLFLDEVGELPFALQAKLLRLLQEKEVRRVGGVRTRKVDLRFLAATNRDLRQAVRAGTFRQDLYDRLATVTITMPPLRERLEDLPLLVAELLPSLARQLGLVGVQATGDFLAALTRHTWPGNVRELEAVLIQALTRCSPGQLLAPTHLPWQASEEQPLAPWEVAKEQFARAYFRRLLAACGGNRTQAARLAGISRQVLHYHLRQLGLAQEEGPNA